MNLPDNSPDLTLPNGQFFNYSEVISYLYSRLPMFSRQGAVAIKAGLINTQKFCSHLFEPQKKFKSIHIGGTNGKGSTSHMLAAILQTAGYKTGLYTSPHLKDFRERIKINGQMISEQEVIKFVNEHYDFIEKLQPSFFEVTVAMAFEHFANNQVDIAIIEVGLGGRLDSTNIITPVLSLISNIGFDHMNILGDSLPLIAGEKAGIIKKGVPVIISQKQDEVSDVFLKKVAEQKAELVFASEEWKISKNEEAFGTPELLSVNITDKNNLSSSNIEFRQIDLDLTGTYQIKNLSGVLSAVKKLKELDFQISGDDIKSALRQVKALTGLMGRWQIIQRNPLLICDTGHNVDGIREVLKNIDQISYEQLHLVMGMLRDKDISEILRILPKNAIYYFCSPDLPRAKSAIELMEEAKAFNLLGKNYSSVQDAVNSAKKNAGKNDLIFVGGSTFVVAELL